MFGSEVVTDWQPGSPIVWQGDNEGKPYQDKGEIPEIEPVKRMKVTHFSPLSGQADVPENYHTLTYNLDERGARTHLSLSQDNIGSEDEAERAQGAWDSLLEGLKKTVEGDSVLRRIS